MLPTIEQLFEVSLDDQGQPIGLRRDPALQRRLAAEVSAEALLGAVESHERLETLLGSLTLLQRYEPGEDLSPEATTRLEATLEGLIADPRAHIWRWGTQSYQEKRFEVGPLAAEARLWLMELALRRWHHPSRSNSSPRPEAEACLVTCLSQALDNMGGPEAVRIVLRGVRNLWWRIREPEDFAASLARCFEEAACDRRRVAILRAMAARELHRAAGGRPQPIGDAFSQALERVLSELTHAVGDEAQDIRLRRRMGALLMEIAPERLNALQGLGLLESAPMAPLSELLSPWGRPLEDRLGQLARTVSMEALEQALNSDDPQERLAAASLVPQIAPRGDWRALAGRLIEMVEDTTLVALPHGIDARRAVDLGDFASERLIKLLSAELRQGSPEAFGLLHEALARVLGRDAVPGRGATDLSRRFVDFVRWLSPETRQKFDAQLGPLLERDDLDPTARHAAALLAQTPEARLSALRLVEDPQADPALRAWLGTMVHSWCPEPIQARVHTDGEVWALREDQEATLPIGEPPDKVPMGWLVTALAMARHTPLRFQLIRGLGQRLVRAHHAQSQEHLALGLGGPGLLESLRAAMDHPQGYEAPRWHAALALALLGQDADEGRLVEYIAGHGPWSRLDPLGEEIRGTKPLEHLVLRPLEHDEPHHLIEPYLERGFGAEHAQRLMAQAFAQMGNRALGNGRVEQAVRALRRAVDLDPLNFAARRGARALGMRL